MLLTTIRYLYITDTAELIQQQITEADKKEAKKNSKTETKGKRKFKYGVKQKKFKRFKTQNDDLNQVTNHLKSQIPISESPAFLDKKLDPQKFRNGYESEDIFSDKDMATTILTTPPVFENCPPALHDTSDDELLPPTPPPPRPSNSTIR